MITRFDLALMVGFTLVGTFNMKRPYERFQMRLLERLANQIGNEGTLFHEIASAFKDSNYESDALQVAKTTVIEKDNEITKLVLLLQKVGTERDFYKHLADRNHKANLKPCPNCGHVPIIIKA